MAILRCPVCRRRTTDDVDKCPHCGRTVDESFEWIAGRPASASPQEAFVELGSSKTIATGDPVRRHTWFGMIIIGLFYLGALSSLGGAIYWTSSGRVEPTSHIAIWSAGLSVAALQTYAAWGVHSFKPVAWSIARVLVLLWVIGGLFYLLISPIEGAMAIGLGLLARDYLNLHAPVTRYATLLRRFPKWVASRLSKNTEV